MTENIPWYYPPVESENMRGVWVIHVAHKITETEWDNRFLTYASRKDAYDAHANHCRLIKKQKEAESGKN